MVGPYHPDLLFIHRLGAHWTPQYYQPMVYGMMRVFHQLGMDKSGFMMKLPYLLVEIPCLFIIASFGRKNMFYAWLFNPIVLFSVYCFGQYRIIPAAYTWAFLWAMTRGKKNLGYLIFCVLSLTDLFPFILFPIVLLGFNEKPRDRIITGAFCVLWVLNVLFILHGFQISHVASTQAFGATTHHYWIYVILKIAEVAGFAVLIAMANKKNSIEEVIQLCFGALCLIYATSPVAIHYLMWAIPFLLFIRTEKLWSNQIEALWMLLPFLFNINALAFLGPVHEFRIITISARALFTFINFYFVLRVITNNSNTVLAAKKLAVLASYN